MDSRYRRYAQHIPKYLVHRPRELVTHCLKKISIANSADLTKIVMIDHGLFSTLSHKCGYEETYMTSLEMKTICRTVLAGIGNLLLTPVNIFLPYSENFQLGNGMLFPHYTDILHF